MSRELFWAVVGGIVGFDLGMGYAWLTTRRVNRRLKYLRSLLYLLTERKQ